jgi:FkbM family methyltransferase
VPAVFEVLEANIALHGLAAQAHRVAMAGSVGERDLVYYPNNSVMSGLHGAPDEDAAVTGRFMLNSGFRPQDLPYFLQTRFDHQRLRCPTTTFAAHRAAQGVENVDLLKIDVEKAELEVLQGIAPGDWPRIRQVVVEVHNLHDRLRDIRALLEARGFRVEVSASPLLTGTGLYDVHALRAATNPPSAFESVP